MVTMGLPHQNLDVALVGAPTQSVGPSMSLLLIVVQNPTNNIAVPFFVYRRPRFLPVGNMSSGSFENTNIMQAGVEVQRIGTLLTRPGATDDNRERALLVELEAHVRMLLGFLTTADANNRDQAMHWLGTIAGFSAPCRDLVLEAGIMQPLLAILNKESEARTVRKSALTLKKLCESVCHSRNFFKLMASIPTLSKLLLTTDEEVTQHACWALSELTSTSITTIEAVIECGIGLQLIALLSSASTDVQLAALSVVGNIAKGNDIHRQHLVDSNALPCFLVLLSSSDTLIRRFACRTVAVRSQYIQAVIESEIIPILIQLLTHRDFGIQRAATFTISKALLRGNQAQIMFLVKQGCVPPLCDFLSLTKINLLNWVLRGIEKILAAGEADIVIHDGENQMALLVIKANGLDKIQAMQMHHNNTIYKLSFNILETYFESVTIDRPMRVVVTNVDSCVSDSEQELDVPCQILVATRQPVENSESEMATTEEVNKDATTPPNDDPGVNRNTPNTLVAECNITEPLDQEVDESG